MKKWIPVLLLAFVAACAATRKEPPPRPFTGTKWVVELELPIPGEQPYLRFGDGRLEGWGGCNRILARYVQDTVGARAIVIGRIETGSRGCDPGAQSAERRVIEVLQAVSSYSITVDKMTMTGSAGTIKLRADPPSEAKP